MAYHPLHTPAVQKKDPAHWETDQLVYEAEGKAWITYAQAGLEVEKKYNEYMEKFAKKDAEKKALVDAGLMKKKDYLGWRKGQIMAGERWEAMKSTLAEDLTRANRIAKSAIIGHMPDAYSINHNYATYLVEHNGLVDTSYTLYDRHTVERLLESDPDILPPPGKKTLKDISTGKLKKWQEGQIQSVTLQSILQGESIPHTAKRIANELSTRGYKDCVRYARTAMTEAENAGREAAYERAEAMGIKMREVWLATLDGRTRHEHRMLDGEEKDVGGYWTVDGMKIRYPGDPTADPSLVYNCRCTTIAQLEGFERNVKGFDLRNDPALGGMSYEEWKTEKAGNSPYGKAKKEYEEVEQKVAAAPGIHDVLTGIWKNKDVGYADWEDVKNSIAGKEQFYQDQIAQYQNNPEQWAQDKAAVAQMHLNELAEYKANGQKYYDLLQEEEQAKQKVDSLAPNTQSASGNNFDTDAYSQARKDAALWAKTQEEADDHMRAHCGDLWRQFTAEEKDALYEYTMHYKKYNEPLRGIEYGTNRYKGVGNTDLNAGYQNNGKRLNLMTDALNKSMSTEDTWLQRGCGFDGMDKFFQCDMSLLQNGTEDELKKELLGKEVTEFAFGSCGSSKGYGFSGDILLNIYTPKGTKMMYVEPFSYYGAELHNKNGGRYFGKNWDGKRKQANFGSELETILQQGTRFEVKKIERSGRWGTIYVDLDVIDQSKQQRWKEP